MINENVVSEVRLIGADGDHLGIMPSSKALEKAKSVGLDLVALSSTSSPPVCKLLNYSRLLSDMRRKEKENKLKVFKLKELRLSTKIAENDVQTKMNMAIHFLKKGNPVRISIILPRKSLRMLNMDIADTKEKVNDDNYNDDQDMEKELDNNNNAEDSLAKNNISNTKENRISRNKNKEINDSKKDLVVHDKEVLQLAHEMINNVAERLAEFGKEEEEPRRITEISLSSIFRPSKTPENKERKQVEIEKNSNDSAAAILPMEIGISESDAVIDVIEEEEEIDDDSGLRLSFERRKHLEAKRKKKSKLSTEFDKVDKEKNRKHL